MHLYQAIVPYINQGMSAEQIGKKLGHTKQHIHQAAWSARKHGLLPPTGRPYKTRTKTKNKTTTKTKTGTTATSTTMPNSSEGIQIVNMIKANFGYKEIGEHLGLSPALIRGRAAYYRKCGFLPRVRDGKTKRTIRTKKRKNTTVKVEFTPGPTQPFKPTTKNNTARPLTDFPVKLETIFAELDACTTAELTIIQNVVKTRYDW